MERIDVSNNENILVKVDQNNLIYIDPNSVVDKDGNILPRNVNHEQLIIYANLEADIIPRSTFSVTNDKDTLVSIASGNLNFLRNQQGGDFDTSWTDAFTNNLQNENNQLQFNKKISENRDQNEKYKTYDSTGQSFGIDNISINIKGVNSIPTVTINFIDVRGKTLFEEPQNSPYSAFFHIPWPIFYLTLKGFYGKAIKYRLHLIKFSSKYNDSTGNFEITTIFIGSTFAYLSDISLKAILNSPYMYLVETTKPGTKNEKTGLNEVVISKSSRGMATLNSVYSEYKKKGLIAQDFPTITLRELITKSQALDKILEKQILYEKLSPNIFVGLKDFEDVINNFYVQVNSWGKKYLNVTTSEFESLNGKNIKLFTFKDVANINNNAIIISDKEGGLNYILTKNNERILNNKLFTDELLKATKDGKTGGGDFTQKKLLSKKVDNISKYYTSKNGKYYVKIELLIEDIDEIRNVFVQEREKLENFVEQEMNNFIKKNTKDGLGFEPTIRNIFAVVLANADVYIRLMKDVHRKAYDKGKERSVKLKTFSKETKIDGPIYPWPEVKKNADNNKSRVIAYPGEKELIQKLNSDDFSLWPEVEFVEEFIDVATNKSDPNVENENNVNKITYVYSNDENTNNTNIISSLEYVNKINPYTNREPAAFFYEIYERANYFTAIDSFSNDIIKDLTNKEYENILEASKEDNTLITLLKNRFINVSEMTTSLLSSSPFERYPYYNDQLPTTNYLIENLNLSHQIIEYSDKTNKTTNQDYVLINNELKKYKPENYRKNIYPFNSSTYLSYLGINSFDVNELDPNGSLLVDSSETFVISPISPKSYVKNDYVKNLFSNKLQIDNTKTNILNTPYFHNQLYTDYFNESIYGKYASSAYLLLTSLPFYDLEDIITFSSTNSNVRMSSLFREIGATHHIPYHLICKWGALYHRYKKFILEGVDILNGCVDINNLTKPIDTTLFSTNNKTEEIYTKYTIGTNTINFTDNKDVGIHPYYDAIFHDIINDYAHFNVISGNTSYKEYIDNNAIKLRSRTKPNNINYWTQFVDNSIYDSTDLRYTIMPSDGSNVYINLNNSSGTLLINISNETYSSSSQSNFRLIWENDFINNEFLNKKFPSHDKYFNNLSNTTLDRYIISDDYRKVIDLIATFSPNILDNFEEIFLRFSSGSISQNNDSYFPNISYTKFQTLLKDMVSVVKENNDNTLTIDDLIKNIQTRQQNKLNEITEKILSEKNTVKLTIGNPKEVNYHVWNGFSDVDDLNTFSYNSFNINQVTEENLKLIKLYLGEDIDSHYFNFFVVNNVELNETNILEFRPLIQIYGGYINSGGTNDTISFKTYLRNNVINNMISRKDLYLQNLLPNLSKLKTYDNTTSNTKFVDGYETDNLKVELYNYFKSFNDKWVSGNSIGQRLLLEEFLFLDKANKDIGESFYLNLDRVIELGKQKLEKTNLYSIISILIRDTGIDMRPLPAYINFYGTNYNNKLKITPSKKVATNLFGTFLEVDYQESSPKIILQLVGQTSKHLDIINKKYKFVDDSFNISNPNNNPIIISPDVFSNLDLSKSNRVVAFEVSFGDQNQSIFKSVQLDQTTIKNTTESFVVLENLARSESGAGAYNVDISLFDYYRQASYTCDVTCMGNVMIQPTMYFYLKNVPMFRGSYWITEVTHSIKGNNFTTSFKGTRIPYASLPDPKDSFISSYRVLFDRLRKNSLKKQSDIQTGNISTQVTILNPSDNKNYTTNIGYNFQGENFERDKVSRAGYYKTFMIPYNGYDNKENIQLTKYSYSGIAESEWLRTRVYGIGVDNDFIINDNEIMNIITTGNKKYYWKDIKELSKTQNYYSIDSGDKIKPENLRKTITTFVNPINKNIVKIPSTLTTNQNSLQVSGPVYSTTASNFGVGMSFSLMKTLGLENGNIVYFIIQ